MSIEKLTKIFSKVQARSLPCFDLALMKNCQLISLNSSNLTTIGRFQVKILPEFCNYHNQVTTGALTMMLDNFTFLTVLASDTQDRQALSSDISVSFISSANLGENLEISTEVIKISSTLAFVQGSISSSTQTVARGRQTMTFLNLPNTLLH